MSAATFTSPPLIPPIQPTSRLLSELLPGDVGTIAEVVVDDLDAVRLKALGICAGRTVRVVAAGHPLIVRVLGSRVGLSAKLAAQVTVRA